MLAWHGNSHPLKLVLQQHKYAIISKGQHKTRKYSYVPDSTWQNKKFYNKRDTKV